MDKLDKKDYQILYYLDLNGRAYYSEIAKKTKLSKQVVKYRVERLEKLGIIQGYYTQLDLSTLGLTTLRIYLKFHGIDKKNKLKIIGDLKKNKSIWALGQVAGKWDLNMAMSKPHIVSFQQEWDDILHNYLEHIRDYNVVIYSLIHRYSRSYLIGKEDESEQKIFGSYKLAKIDAKDLSILLHMTDNARISLLELSQRIKISPEAISKRIKRLEKKNVIQGYRARININKLGYNYYKADIRLKNYSQLKNILSFCQRHPNIYQTNRTLGGETLEIEFHVKKNSRDVQNIRRYSR